MGKADVIIGIKMIRLKKELSFDYSHYIKKIGKYNYFDCEHESTPLHDPIVIHLNHIICALVINVCCVVFGSIYTFVSYEQQINHCMIIFN